MPLNEYISLFTNKKTKYLVMTKRLINTIDLNKASYFLKQINYFKYQGVNINSKKKVCIIK